MESPLHWADYLIFVVFLFISLAIGVYHACTGGRQKTTQEFIMADRELHIFPTMLSLLVSFQSAIMIVGFTAEIYTYGTQYWVVATSIGFPFAILVAERVLVPWIFPLQLTSIYSYFELRFHSRAIRVYGAVLGLLSSLLYIGPAMYAPSVALEAVNGFPMDVSIPVMAVVSTAYTALGGMRAVIWTDVFQGSIMFAGLFTVLIKGSYILGGFGPAMEYLNESGRLVYAVWDPDPRLRHSFWSLSFGTVWVWCFIYGLSQASVQRYSATKSLRQARIVMLLNIPAVTILQCLSFMMGVVCVAYFYKQQCDPLLSGHAGNGNQIVPYYVKTIFAANKGFSGLFLVTLYSGALSSVSSSLSACAAIAWDDIFQHRFSRWSQAGAAAFNKVLVVVFGALGAAVAFLAAAVPGPVTQVAISFGSSVVGPLFGMLLLGGVFRAAEWRGTLAGGIISLGFSAWLCLMGSSTQGPQPKLPPLSTDGCSDNSSLLTEQFDMNATTNHAWLTEQNVNLTTKQSPVMEEPTSTSGLYNFYSLSYLYYSFFGASITVILGLSISCFSRRFWPEDEEERIPVPDELFINWRNVFTFGELSVKKDPIKRDVRYRETSREVDDIDEKVALWRETSLNSRHDDELDQNNTGQHA